MKTNEKSYKKLGGKMKIYAISNPAFLSDTFIFKNIKDVWNCGPIDEWFYIKLNRRNKIEEIGVNIENRIMQPLKNDLLKEANKTQKEYSTV